MTTETKKINFVLMTIGKMFIEKFSYLFLLSRLPRKLYYLFDCSIIMTNIIKLFNTKQY